MEPEEIANKAPVFDHEKSEPLGIKITKTKQIGIEITKLAVVAEIADTASFPNNEYIPHAMPAIAIRTLAVMFRVKFSLGQSKYISPENAMIAPILLFLGIFGLVKNDDANITNCTTPNWIRTPIPVSRFVNA